MESFPALANGSIGGSYSKSDELNASPSSDDKVEMRRVVRQREGRDVEVVYNEGDDERREGILCCRRICGRRTAYYGPVYIHISNQRPHNYPEADV
jgi:hypothetical protein